MQWESVIGLEIHVQLATKSKLFSGASTAYGASNNTQACAVDLGLPGVLPVLNREAVHKAIKFGIAIGAEVAPTCVFARKNYFYPDLPKGYQISQMDYPIVGRGNFVIQVDGADKTIGITRAHLEEDAGKSLHENFQGMSGIDLNRAGTPLLEIVSEPDMRSAQEAVIYMRKIHQLVRYLNISDGNMQEGSFRCDANVSVRHVGDEALGTRTELKNINSFRFVEKAINLEIARQIEVLETGGSIRQETRLYDAERQQTRPMRSKEEANDYRYFPDPDLLPVAISRTWYDAIAATIGELPDAKKSRFQSQYQQTLEIATLLTASTQLADFYEAVVELSGDAKLCTRWVSGHLLAALHKENLAIEQSPIDQNRFAELLKRIADQTISEKAGKQVFKAMWSSPDNADEIIAQQNLQQMTDSAAVADLIDKVIADNPSEVQQYLDGKDKVLGFLVGQTIKASKGKANPAEVSKLLRGKLR